MPLEALALVLVAALLHATWNIAAKKAGGGAPFVLLGALLMAFVWSPVAWFVGRVELPTWGWTQWGLAFASGAVHLLYFNVLLAGYRASDLTVVYPVARGTGPLLTALVAFTLLGEAVTMGGALGVALVTVGVFLIAGGVRMLGGGYRPEERARMRAGIAWGSATGVLIAAYSVIDGVAVKHAGMSPIVLDYVGNVLRIPLMLPLLLRDRTSHVAAWREQWRAALWVAVLGPVAYVLVLYAVKLAPLSHVAPAREVSMLVAALLGGKLLGEGDRKARLAGAGAIAIGVAALALG